jgi:hypothetical protein
MTYAIVDPTNHTKGMNENALAIFVSSDISPTADFKTPTLPLSAPDNARLAMTVRKECDSPKLVMERATPNKPIIRTGLRPTRSDRRPHWSIKIASTRKKIDSYVRGESMLFIEPSNNTNAYD